MSHRVSKKGGRWGEGIAGFEFKLSCGKLFFFFTTEGFHKTKEETAVDFVFGVLSKKRGGNAFLALPFAFRVGEWLKKQNEKEKT